MDSPNTQLSGTALVIDDQETLLAVALEMLTAKGMNVLTARSGQEGIELFQKHAQTIDVVLLDMKMPDFNGDVVFARLKVTDPAVRVIVTSGYERREALAPFDNQPGVAFIQKPYRFKFLAEMIADILAEKL